MITFKEYAKEDFPVVEKIWKATGMGGKERGDDHPQIMKTITYGGKLILMCLNNKIIGTSWISSDNRRLYLHHFGILPKYQGKGYSHFLMRETLKFVKEKNMQVKLEVHQDNIIAVQLYEKYGFYQFGDYNSMIIRKPQEISLS